MNTIANCKVCNALRNQLSQTEKEEMEILMQTSCTDFYVSRAFRDRGVYISHDSISRHRLNHMSNVPTKKESKYPDLQTPYQIEDLIGVNRRRR